MSFEEAQAPKFNEEFFEKELNKEMGREFLIEGFYDFNEYSEFIGKSLEECKELISELFDETFKYFYFFKEKFKEKYPLTFEKLDLTEDSKYKIIKKYLIGVLLSELIFEDNKCVSYTIDVASKK